MKITKIYSLLFIPLALCTTVPSEASDAEIANLEQADKAALDSFQTQASLLTLLGLAQGISDYFVNFEQAANKALRESEDSSHVENWPFSVSEWIQLVDSKLAANSESENPKESAPLRTAIDGITGIINEFSNELSSKIRSMDDSVLANVEINNEGESLSVSSALNVLKAQLSSRQSKSYVDQFFGIIARANQEIFEDNPSFLSVFTDSSEENLKRFFETITRVFTRTH